MPRAKETLSKLAVPRVSSQIKYDFGAISGFSKEHPRTCDICRLSETFLNQIVVCLSCKVAIRLDCYRSVKDSTGPWYCKLCEDLLSSRSSGASVMNSWEKPYFSPECGLCGGNVVLLGSQLMVNGWAFCAEWVLEATFRRGQENPVEGMESVLKGSDVCYICHRKQGVCIKCNYGHCQSTFHPTCARTASCYMNMKKSGSKLQHKAYCEKHSSEQRAKAETQGHEVEELKSLKENWELGMRVWHGNEVSTFGDVYSYGILLLEMLTGKRPTDSMFSGSLSFHIFAKMALPEQVANIVDPSLLRQCDMGEAISSINNTHDRSSPRTHKLHEHLVSILKVGIACSQELPKDHMEINDVVSHRSEIVRLKLAIDAG